MKHYRIYVEVMLLGFSNNVVVSRLDPSKMYYFRRIRHAPGDIFKESKQHSVEAWFIVFT